MGLFFTERNLPVASTWPRYVGNKFVILGLIAMHLVLHRALVILYCTSFCSLSSGRRSAVLADIQDENIYAQLVALGHWHKFFMVPWMSK